MRNIFTWPVFDASTCFGNHSATNQILQETVAILDCRYLPNSHPDEILAAVKKAIRDPNIQVNIERQGTVQYYTTPEYFYNELEKAIVQVFPNSQVVPILLPAGNDNSYFRKSGCPVYGLYPMIVSSKQLLSIHNSNEYLDLEDIDNGIKVFESFLQSVQHASPLSLQLKQPIHNNTFLWSTSLFF